MRLIDLFGSQINEMASFNLFRKASDSLGFFANRRVGRPTTIVLPHYGTLESANNYTVITLRPKVGNDYLKYLVQQFQVGRVGGMDAVFAELWANVIPYVGKEGFAAQIKPVLNVLKSFPKVFKVVDVDDKAKLYQMLTTMGMTEHTFRDFFGEAPGEAAEHGMDLHGANVYFPDIMQPKRREMLIGFLNRTYQTLASQGLGEIFAGTITFAPLQKTRGGDWDERTKQMRVNPNTKNDMQNFYTLIHEYGHKYMDLFMEPQTLEAVKEKWAEVHKAGHRHNMTPRLLNSLAVAADESVQVGDVYEYLGKGKKKGRWQVSRIYQDFDRDLRRVINHINVEQLPEKNEYVVRPASLKGPALVLLNTERWKKLKGEPARMSYHDAYPERGTYESDEWFPSEYSESKFVEWWAELFAHHMLGQLRGEPAEWMQTIIPSSRVAESIMEQYNDWEDEEWQPQTQQIPAGVAFYHGTQAPMDWWDESQELPDTPFWVSEDQGVATKFATWNEFPGEMAPRVITYKTSRPLNMLVITGRDDMEYLEEYWGIDIDDPREMAEGICAKGYDGWVIPNNYQPGDDVMICVADALDYQGTAPLQQTTTGGWEGQTL